MFNSSKIKRLLDSYSGTQLEFSRISGIPKTTITSMLNKGNPTSETIEAFADFFKAPIDYFFDRKVEIDPKYLNEEHNVKKKKEEKSESIKDLISEIKDLTKQNVLQDQEIQRLRAELENKKSGGNPYGIASEPQLEMRQ